MRLTSNLVLFNFIAQIMGGDYPTLARSLSQTREGKDNDGHSSFYGALTRLSKQPKLDALKLQSYDTNIMIYQDQIAATFSGFRLKYYQYLAALWTEIYLDNLTYQPAQFLQNLETFRAAKYSHLPPYTAEDLNKLAFWMATGSGKTLLLHLNLKQFLKYRLFEPSNILLITPTLTLATQHLEDLARSGITATYGLDVPDNFKGVQVLEISKIYLDGATGRTHKGGESLPVSQFIGSKPNLLLIDEGHKGTYSHFEQKSERVWRDIRQALIAGGGFTFEYSATFGQMAEKDEVLYHEYSRCLGFEYAYGRFYHDKYGKDFWAANLKDYDLVNAGEMLMLGGLLTFYEASRLYHERETEFAEYNLEAPLMVFVGATVNSSTGEVLEIIRFLDRVLSTPTETTINLEKLMQGRSGLPGAGGLDLFYDKFTYLRSLHLSAQGLYQDLVNRLFRGQGRLTFSLLKRNEGEIGLRLTDSHRDAYCGVINVGDPVTLLKNAKATGLIVAQDDLMSGSLFNLINQPGNHLNFLIGSKKFIEGWSSFRVQVMGLLRVGKAASAQVIQLFGRGVRLKGFNNSLKRSSEEEGSPEYLKILETLSIFSLKADYLKTFLETLQEEGVAASTELLLELTLEPAFETANLRVLELDTSYRFKEQNIKYQPQHSKTMDLSFRVETLSMGRSLLPTENPFSENTVKLDQIKVPASVLRVLDYERLFYAAIRYKNANEWSNLYLTREAVENFFTNYTQIKAKPEQLNPTSPGEVAILNQVAATVLEASIRTFYLEKQKLYESQHLYTNPLTRNHPNFPTFEDANGVKKIAYMVDVNLPLLSDIQAIINDAAQLLTTDSSEPLPRLHFDRHLYWPLLLRSQQTRFHPTGLVDSERKFVVHLENFWVNKHSTNLWQGIDLYLLRNLPKAGIGFFKTAGFYPDFLLWLKQDHKQVLVFVDPKGIGLDWPGEKIELLKTIEGYGTQATINMPLLAYIVTDTPLDKIASWYTQSNPSKEQWLKDQNVLLQNTDAYIAHILDEAKKALANLP